MAKIYFAGKDLKRARKVMNKLRSKGHIITFDWLKDIGNEKNPKKKAIDERSAVIESEVLVYLWGETQESARYEAGMAMGLHKPIIVSGSNELFFLTLPEVVCVDDDNEIIQVIDRINSVKN